MLWHVYNGVSKANRISDVWVLTDSQEVMDIASAWGAKTMITSPDCSSGTARIASVADKLDADIIVNVQADEPLITGAIVDGVVSALDGTNAEVSTPVFRITTTEDIADPNLVKVVRATDGTALYFSRSSIPYVRDRDLKDWLSAGPFWGHVGLYGYRRSVLLKYNGLPEGSLERVEKLEQLRLLEAGIPIMTVEIDYRPRGVDVPSDLDAVREILKPTPHTR